MQVNIISYQQFQNMTAGYSCKITNYLLRLFGGNRTGLGWGGKRACSLMVKHMLDTQKAQSPTPMPQLVFYCSDKTLIKTNFWRKTFGLHVLGHNLSVRKLRTGSQGRDLESRPEAEAREKCCLLILLAMDQSICFSVPRRATCAGNGTSHSGLDPLTSVIIKENAPQSCLQTNLMEAFSN